LILGVELLHFLVRIIALTVEVTLENTSILTLQLANTFTTALQTLVLALVVDRLADFNRDMEKAVNTLDF
jgi:hypothetical protein